MTQPLSAYNRKKQPDLVKRQLLDCALHLMSRDGVAATSLQAIAEAAGVTKGGLLHHFPNKQALIRTLLEDLFQHVVAQVERFLSEEPVGAHGRFTRAYIRSSFHDKCGNGVHTSLILECVKLQEEDAENLWKKWLTAQLTAHKDTDGGLRLEALRRAADGVWCDRTIKPTKTERAHLEALKAELVSMTFKE